MGDRVTVLFTDGTSVSNTGVFFHHLGSVVGITIEEIWPKLESSTSLNECCQLLQERTRDLCLEWGHYNGSPFIPKIKPLETEERANPRLLDCGDEGVLIVNVNLGTIRNLRGDRWARTYTVKRLANIHRKNG